jgi:deoxyhypusine monooxygenase
MVKAAEAMGAIGQMESLNTLNKFVQHPLAVIAETCELAIARINYENSDAKQLETTSTR